MRKKLSLLKPHLNTIRLDNEIAEQVTYLNIPSTVDAGTLEADIRLGAEQFKGLTELLEKENEPKYIVITCNNLEQGYMAVTYLAAGFNRKHGIEAGEDCEYTLDEEETWKEDSSRIPVIEFDELRQGFGDGNQPFGMNGLFMQGMQQTMNHKPYWMDCTSESVCLTVQNEWSLVSHDYQMSSSERLEYFKHNDKVYLLILDRMMGVDYSFSQEYEDRDFFVTSDRVEINNIVLSLTAEEVTVQMEKEKAKVYYKSLLKGIFASMHIKAAKGFQYERLVNMVSSMCDPNKCQLTEHIVKYAMKDKKDGEERIITNKDFDFMDRFCRAQAKQKNGRHSARVQMEKELVGMEEVKKQVLSIVNVMKYNQMRAKMGIHGGSYHNVHMMLGAPGTAKTTVAKLMGEIMMEERLLPDNRFICVNGAELKGMYVGHSAPKTKALFEENDIIVIDEAYSLVGDYGKNDSFSKEAIAQLIIELESHSMDKLVIFAGYGGRHVSEVDNKMKDFLDANPGIKSRITSTIYFDSYTPAEMVEIFFRIAKNQHYCVDENVTELVYAHFEKRMCADNFGNGREARRLLETAVAFAAGRVFEQGKKKYSKADMQRITYSDVQEAVCQKEKEDSVQNTVKKGKIGFRS